MDALTLIHLADTVHMRSHNLVPQCMLTKCSAVLRATDSRAWCMVHVRVVLGVRHDRAAKVDNSTSRYPFIH